MEGQTAEYPLPTRTLPLAEAKCSVCGRPMSLDAPHVVIPSRRPIIEHGEGFSAVQGAERAHVRCYILDLKP
jgi:hypothetical protein